ncbi:MAG: penicillin-binding protein 2 [Eubacterium sp.]|nr:penicillin-binding protein 2 [Eubacterium sp.]
MSRRRKSIKKLSNRMRKKLFQVFFLILIAVCVLIGRIIYIQMTDGDKYEKIVLSQQEYSSQTVPFRRGDIVDSKGTILATSTDVYNVILDCSVVTAEVGGEQKYIEPTVAALVECFGFDEAEIREQLTKYPDKMYYVLAKQLPYEEIQKFEELKADEEKGKNIKGVWFEKEYIRNYPYETLASSLLGYTVSGNVGVGGIEDQYNETLNGTDGRTYGYLNDDSNFETTVKEAVNGQTVVSTIDVNIQSIVEEKMQEFNEAYANNYREGSGSKHIAVIVADPNTNEILAMAKHPNFNNNDPRDLSQYYSEEELEAMSDEQTLEILNDLWNNFCITYTYEPGSTAKPLTVACGLETGVLTGGEVYECDGVEHVGGHDIHCVNRNGHGTETIADALADSCNDALMQMSYRIGTENFVKYQQIFNIGLKTNIDLPGEARTASLIYTEETMDAASLATNAFGQNFNVTMVQMVSAYNSLVNGGSYYLPHVVKAITDENGNTVEEIKPTLLRQTISETTSQLMIQFLEDTVNAGTGKAAKVDGYSMCGKTGTAEKFVENENGVLVRDENNYLISFIGSVPAENPEVTIYIIIDEPNVEDQAHSSYAQHVVREILEELLPYMNIYPDEELTGLNKDLDIMGNPISTTTSAPVDTIEQDTVPSDDTVPVEGNDDTQE